MAQIGERIERSESLPGPTGRFDGFVPLMFHPSALPSTLSPLRPFATVACKYERSFIRTESNSPNNVFLPPCPDARSARRWFPSVRECTVIPFLRAADCRKREAAGVDEERGHDAREREGGKSPDNQRLWRRAIVLPILRGVVKDACYERRTDKMTDRNKFSFSRRRHCRPVSPRSETTTVINGRSCAFLTYYSRDSAISAQNALHEKRTLPGYCARGCTYRVPSTCSVCATFRIREYRNIRLPPSNNYADLTAHRGNGGRFRGAKDIEKTRETAGKRGEMGVGKSSDGTAVRTRALEKGRLFALRTTEQIRHADDDVDDSSRADCHANHGTERPVIDSQRPFSSLPRFAFSSRAESSFLHEITTVSSSTVQSSFTADRPFYGERAWHDAAHLSCATCVRTAARSPVEIEKTLFAPTRSWKTSGNARNRNCASKPPYLFAQANKDAPLVASLGVELISTLRHRVPSVG
ncbi:hypothetical protein ALC60_09325 [Trachymyrmex zeteki]|uniref:Uncharacterized protein n=1 Tax=Mycetomoellerius zeteki TaxID=64791 RepID=A0A151WUG2_9HYME|nr:hypothetical protein ALC60_09325 [Trachymyrmex zeteki]